MIAMFAFCGYARRPKIKRHAKTQCGHGHNQNDAARRGPLSHCGPHISSEEFEDEISRIGPMRAEGPRFFHKAPLYLWTFSIRQGLGIVASSNADQNWRQWPFATTRVRTRRHTTLLSERGAFTDGICEASLSLESQADSLPDGQDYKPAQKHFVDIFSAQAHGRFNSRRLNRKFQRKSSFPPRRSCWMEASSLTPARSRLVAAAEANSTIAERTTTRESRVRRENSDAAAEGRSAPTASPMITPPMWAALLMPGTAAPNTKL